MIESHEKIYIGLSILLFFASLIFGKSGIQGRHGGELFDYLYILFCFIMVVIGMVVSFGARKKGDVFWISIVATLLACSYLGIKLS